MSSTKDSNQSIEKDTGYSFSMTPNTGISAYTTNTLNFPGNISYLETWFSLVTSSHEISTALFQKVKTRGHLENIIIFNKIPIPSQYHAEIIEVYCKVKDIPSESCHSDPAVAKWLEACNQRKLYLENNELSSAFKKRGKDSLSLEARDTLSSFEMDLDDTLEIYYFSGDDGCKIFSQLRHLHGKLHTIFGNYFTLQNTDVMRAIKQEAFNLTNDYKKIKLQQSSFSSRIGCINKMEHLYQIFKSHFQQTQGTSKNDLERNMMALCVTDINDFETFIFEFNSIDKTLSELNGGGVSNYYEGEDYLDVLNQMCKHLSKETDPRFRKIIHKLYTSRGNETIRSTRLGINNYIKEEIKNVIEYLPSDSPNHQQAIPSVNGAFANRHCDFCSSRNRRSDHPPEMCWKNPDSSKFRPYNKKTNGNVTCKHCGFNNHSSDECFASESRIQKYQQSQRNKNENAAEDSENEEEEVQDMAATIESLKKQLAAEKRKNSSYSDVVDSNNKKQK